MNNIDRNWQRLQWLLDVQPVRNIVFQLGPDNIVTGRVRDIGSDGIIGLQTKRGRLRKINLRDVLIVTAE